MTQWVTMAYAAKQLKHLGVTVPKLSRLASDGRLTTEGDPTDKRVRLVDFDEVREMYSKRQHRGQ